MKRFSIAIITPIIIFSGGYASAETLSCKKLVYGAADYTENMDALATQAKLADGYWHRYHEDFIRALCNDDIKDINSLVDNGYVKLPEATAIADLLGKPLPPITRSEEGKRFEYLNKNLSRLGLCNACASNVASTSVKYPDSKLAQLVNAAIAGDETAIAQLQAMDTSTEHFSADLLANH